MKKPPKHGGKREGAGRPYEGKAPYTVTLTTANVDRAKAREDTVEGRRGNTTYLDSTIEAVLRKRRNPPMKR